MTYVLLFLANIVAGTINALAGGGGLITFPLLMLTIAPVTADATSAVALFFAYPAAVWRTRSQLDGVFGHGWLWLLLVPCVLGGVVGAVLLSRTGNRNFIEFVPWLVLIATIIIVLRPILVRRDEGGSVHPNITMALWPVAIAGIFLVALYGGYFGAGIGILMIGALSFISRGDIRHVVALKNFLTLCMRGMAVFVLVLQGNVNWKYGAPMAVGGLIGGYVGGMISHRANRTLVRSIVIAIGFARVGVFFLETVRSSCNAYRSRVGESQKSEDGNQRRYRPSFTAANALKFFANREPATRLKPKPCGGSLITYENIECYHSGIVPRVRRCNVSRTESGENFNCNRSAHRNAASRKSIDWSWLGQLGESAPAVERYRSELR
jgi:uncharacterized protein